jgi:hypothetical protein
MIFMFGLPGYRSNRQAMPSILAGRKVLDELEEAGLTATAGISTGVCFCGLVGHPMIRCEYAVMGGEPRCHETSARCTPTLLNPYREYLFLLLYRKSFFGHLIFAIRISKMF